jgi:hypothetical protein
MIKTAIVLSKHLFKKVFLLFYISLKRVLNTGIFLVVLLGAIRINVGVSFIAATYSVDFFPSELGA